MGFPQLVALLVCSLAVVAHGQSFGCPDADTLRPCACDMDGISCEKANSTQDLRRAFNSTGLKEHRGLWIVRTSVGSFPEDVLGDFVFAEIHLNFNSNLTSFSIDSLNNSRPFLRNINLYGNALSTFEFHRINQFPKLTVLNLGKNRLDTIPNWAFSNPQLKKLILAGNPIRSLGVRAFAALPKLEMLNLEGTRITNLGDFALTLYSSYPKLTVNLKESNVFNISKLAFANSSPFSLTLTRNNLTTFPQDVFGPLLTSMRNHALRTNNSIVLDVTGNPFTCRGCSFGWLLSRKYDPVFQHVLHGFRCADRRTLMDLTMSRIQCLPGRPAAGRVN
ncbi:protein slit-like isoform X2 [Ixodes scapularis]|uniref:protein slit-like isoform X2 n=1 Tax=Ixodes scapularis TaxID=6945 RepID=UPI001C386D58|nr:protein slit-like isoform X2 [Ixodes scapularis]